MNQFFTSGVQSIGVSVSASVRYADKQIYRESRMMGMGAGGEGNEASVFNKDRIPVWKR